MASRFIICFLLLAIVNSVIFTDNLVYDKFSSNDQIKYASIKSTGIDISPTKFEFQYNNDVDYNSYGLLSSYSCCDTINRPDTFWIVDGMLEKEQIISITIENRGTLDSGQFDLRVYIEHNEYEEFNIFEQIISVGSITSSSSKIVEINWIPDYSGNHTIHAISLHPQDSDNSNDLLSRHYTVGNIYENANNAGIWTSMSRYWSMDQNTGLTPHDFSTLSRNSFYVGDISTNSYGNNWNENMESSILDFSDRVNSPQESFKISFIASGASRTGDYLNLQIINSQNNWKSLGSISRVIDQNAENWNLFNYNLMPQDMNSNSKLRFNFDSNTVNTEVGYWIDDFVIVYDQVAKNEEYSPKVSTISNGGSSAEEWSYHEVKVVNEGNLEDKISFEILDIPENWVWSVNYLNGGPIDNDIGIEIPKGESRNLELKIKPSLNSDLGINDLVFKVKSMNSPGLSENSKAFKMEVFPTYLPQFQFDEELGYCRPGNFCEFNVTLMNAGDFNDQFSISSENILIRNGWSFGIAWNQDRILDVNQGESVSIKMTVDVPADAIAGQFSSLMITATSGERPDIETKYRINATAGMISNAFISVDYSLLQPNVKEPMPGSTVELPFTLWNNASTFDIFEVCFVRNGYRSWVVESETIGSIIDDKDECVTPIIIDVQALSTKEIILYITIPKNAQSGDSGPTLKPVVKSSRSGDTIRSLNFDNFSVKMVSNLSISELEANNYMNPGSENILTFEINNYGNGADFVKFNILNFVYEWEYWFSDGENTIQSYELSPIYEGRSNMKINLHILIPEDIKSFTYIDFDISIISLFYDTEMDLSDNTLKYTGESAVLFLPEWIIDPINELTTESGKEIKLNATLGNLGNAFDNNLKIKFELESDDDISKINVLLKIPIFSNDYFSEGQWVSVPLEQNQFANIEIIIIIPDDTRVPTKFDLNWIVEGGSNQLGISKNLTNVTTIDVSTYRSVSVDFNIDSNTYNSNERAYFSIDLQSSSSIIEEFNLVYSIPDGVELSCDDPSKDGQFKVIIQASNFGIVKESKFECNLYFSDNSGIQDVEFMIVDSYGDLISSLEIEINVVDQSSNNLLSNLFYENTAIKSMILVFFFVIVILLLVLTNQRTYSDSEEINESEIDVMLHKKQSIYANYQNNQIMNNIQSDVNQSNIMVSNLVEENKRVDPQKTKFTQPKSRPPENNDNFSLDDAFGTLMKNK